MWSGHGLTLSCCVFFDLAGFVCTCVYGSDKPQVPREKAAGGGVLWSACPLSPGKIYSSDWRDFWNFAR